MTENYVPSQGFIDYNKEIEEETNNVVKFELLKGGKEPPSTTGNSWLQKLEVGEVFYLQDKQTSDFTLGLFKLVAKTGTSENICVLVSPDLPKPISVNPNRFCQKYMLYESLGVEKEPETEEVRAEEDNPEVEQPGKPSP